MSEPACATGGWLVVSDEDELDAGLDCSELLSSEEEIIWLELDDASETDEREEETAVLVLLEPPPPLLHAVKMDRRAITHKGLDIGWYSELESGDSI